MIAFQTIGRLPSVDDNCAIAVKRLDVGTAIAGPDNAQYTLCQTILEGHRFAVRPIPAGTPLLSWGKTFGRALRDIARGEYVCNAGVLAELGSRHLDFDLPREPNFADDLTPYQFDAARFQPAPTLPLLSCPFTFMGHRRPGERGVGTRNMVVLLGVTSLAGGFAAQLEREAQPLLEQYEHVDGIVAVTHTEGARIGGNNEQLLLRALAGFLVHPNVGGILALDAASAGVTNEMLRETCSAYGYSLDDVPHRFISLRGPFTVDMLLAKKMVECLLRLANESHRSPQPLGELKIALQCGGSDAFSGISGNPLAALVSKDVIQAGGSAVLAETDELIGAESYVLDKVRDAETARRFLETVDRFQERAARHGHSAHGNPTGGNKYRGLYNIYLKSLGAAAKRHPDVRLDYVIDYGERIAAPGYYFMDSPGNDLESIAGQVASGCNLIFFVTGNGSITNFPFVPTIKIVTTSERYALLADEMDVNAGAYLDGTSLAQLAEGMRDLVLAVASGQRSAGEKAGHAQVQIWRDWPIAGRLDPGLIARDYRAISPAPDGRPLPIQPPPRTVEFTWQGCKRAGGRVVSDRVGLILPASLCSGQVARLAAGRLNEAGLGSEKGISRFAALVHTEGCGSSIEPELVSTVVGYANHPSVAACLVLEHGCEITHNDFWRLRMVEAGLNPQAIGWASVQRDGGIKRVLAEIEEWFSTVCEELPPPQYADAGFRDLQLGLMAEEDVDQQTAIALAALTQQIAHAGGTVILPANDPLAANAAFNETLSLPGSAQPTIAYGAEPLEAGFHLMANPTSSWSETLAGMGAAGVDAVVAVCKTHAQQGHPFIPVLQVASHAAGPAPFHDDMDLLLAGNPQEQLDQVLAQLSAVLSRTTIPKSSRLHNVSFQITRGSLGVSL